MIGLSLFYVIFIVFNSVLAQKYKISFKSESEDTINQIKLIPGQYQAISIIVTSIEQNSVGNKKTTLELSEESKKVFKTIEEQYEIDADFNQVIETYIGVNCNDEYSLNEISFISSNSDFSVDTIQVEYVKNNLMLYVSIPNRDIPYEGYTILNISTFENKELFNIDPIKVNFTLDDKKYESNVEISNITIDEYSTQRKYIYPLYIKVKSIKKESTPKENILYNINIIDNKCISLNTSKFIVHINNDKYSKLETEPIIKASNPSPSTMSLSITAIETPSLLQCIIIPSEDSYDNYTEEIIESQSIKQNDRIRYFTSFFPNEVTNTDTILIKGLNRYQYYKYKCIYDNNANKGEHHVRKIITLKEDSLIGLRDHIDNVLTQCATYKFESIEKIDTFYDLIQRKCYNEIIYSSNNKDKYHNLGCLQCNDLYKDISSKNKRTVCLSSKLTCESKSEYTNSELESKFDSLISQLNSSEKIKQEFTIESTLKDINIAYDIDIDEDSIVVDIDDYKENYMDIIIDNDNNKELSCDINIDSDSKNMTTLFLEKKQQGYKFRFDLPNYTNEKYTIDLTCRTLYDLADVSYAIKAKTSPQIVFFHNDTEHKIDCNVSPHYNRCIKRTVFPLPPINSTIPSLEIDIETFKQYKLSKQISIINMTTLSIPKESHNATLILMVINQVLQMMQIVDCHNELNEMCFDMERKGIDIVFEISLNQIDLYTVIKEANEPDIVKLALAMLFYTGNNADAFGVSIGYRVLSFAASLMKDSNNVISQLIDHTPSLIIDDIFQLYVSFSSHLIDIIPFIETQKYSTPPYTDIIVDETIQKYTSAIKVLLYNFFIHYSSHSDMSQYFGKIHQYSNFGFYIGTILNSGTSYNFNCVNITLPLKTIYRKYKEIDSSIAENIFSLNIVYTKYPLLSSVFKSNKYHNLVVSISLFIDKKLVSDDIFNDPIEISYDRSANSIIDKKYQYGYRLHDNTIDVVNITTNQAKDDIIVQFPMLSEILIGSENKGGKVVYRFEVWMMALCIIVGCLITTFIVYLICFVCAGTPAQRNLIEKQQELNEAPLLAEDDDIEENNKNEEERPKDEDSDEDDKVIKEESVDFKIEGLE